MTILWINLIVVFTFSLLARYYATLSTDNQSIVPVKPNKILTFVALLSLIATSGLRSNIGDTFNYRNIYVDNDFTWEYIFSQKDYGFGILQMILKNYISEDPQIMIFTAALITNTVIVVIFYRYSRMIELSLFVYITGGLFLVSMNGIRQVLAAAITFIAINYLIKGKFVKYTIIVLIASTFHLSALILIPIYFLVRFKAWSKATIILIILSVAVVIGFEQFSNLLFSAIEDTQYGAYKEFDEGGANALRAIVVAIPLVFAYLGRDKLRRIFPESDYIVNMAIIGFVFMLISTQMWIFARISIYFELYQLILISWIISLFNTKEGRLIYYGLIICYFAYYYFESVVNLQILYKSNYLGS